MYEPFRYPPDMNLAKIHSECSLPGDDNPDGRICPCCDVREKTAITNWWRRSIRKDFSKYGGAVITYFSLLKFYIICIIIVICTYSIYEMYSIVDACTDKISDGALGIISRNDCVYTFGVWIISTEDLLEIMKKTKGDRLSLLLFLRGIIFLFLVIVNMLSLYIVERDKRKMERQARGIEDFTLFFKNVNAGLTEQDLKQQILAINPNIEVKQIFFIHKLHRLKKWYDMKIESYFALKSEQKPKQILKLKKALILSVQKLEKHVVYAESTTNRAIVMFNRLQDKELVQAYYKPSFVDNMKILFTSFQQRMYANNMHKPSQVFWHYLGQRSQQKLRMKVITFIVIIVTLALTYGLLRQGLILADRNDKSFIPVIQKFWSSFIAIILVIIALLFRQLMNYLAELRKPNTQTSKTMFIVSTTVIYHFIYFLIVPTIYFVDSQNQQKSLKLFSISYQALNFLVVQIILVVVDIFYCCWNTNRQKIFTKEGQGLCQKQVNSAVSCPRFPIEFKLIILFKTWSFVIFYAFQVPYIMFLILVILIFFYVYDKKHVYSHYKMEIIDSKVEMTFLKIYTNFFTIYLCLIFCLTQNLTYELYLAILITALAVLFQLFYVFRDKPSNYQTFQDCTLEQLNPKLTYKQIYDQFRSQFKNPAIDQEIQLYYNKLKTAVDASVQPINSSLNSEESMTEKMISE